jgi:hypothetical protein
MFPSPPCGMLSTFAKAFGGTPGAAGSARSLGTAFAAFAPRRIDHPWVSDHEQSKSRAEQAEQSEQEQSSSSSNKSRSEQCREGRHRVGKSRAEQSSSKSRAERSKQKDDQSKSRAEQSKTRIKT